MLIGTFLLSALTPGGVEPESATVAQVVSATVPALIVTVLAPVAAIVWGTAAVRAGRRAGFAPLVLGAAAGAYLLLANLAPLLLGALIAL